MSGTSSSRTRVVLGVLGAGFLPFVITLACVLVERSRWTGLEMLDFWAPVVATAVGAGVLMVLFRRWWRLALIPYGFAMFWVQAVTTMYLYMALITDFP